MTSQINPNNIDGTYPVAGQDNNSQGFRTNFTNTVTNFDYAKNEITDLQNKAILNAQLTGGPALSTQNNMQGSPLSNAVLSNMSYALVPIVEANGAFTVNYATGPVQTVTLGSSSTMTITNWPATGIAGSVTVQVTVPSTSYALTLPSAVGSGASAASLLGIQGLSGQIITFAQTGTYSFAFSSNDGGASISIQDLTRPRSYFTNPLFLAIPETIANGNVSLSTTTSVFTSSANVTANLAAGTSGQIKILTYGNTSIGNTRVTVANAAWGGSNIANLNAVGSACTLQYVNSKWVCIGNNGVSFS